MSWLTLLCVTLGAASLAWAAEPEPLALESKIMLGDVKGRIDHFAADPLHERLFVAELGNNTVAVIDLKAGKIVRRIGGLREPQGVGYLPATDTLYAANAGDGSVRLFQGENFVESGLLALGDDADNIRIDSKANQIFVGYGTGALAVIDSDGSKLADIALKAHPEAFQLDSATGRIFVNVPGAAEIAVVDRKAEKQIASWKLPDARSNFPMAPAEAGKQLIVLTRKPARMLVFETKGGHILSKLEACSDADDVSTDTKRQLAYVSCGQGVVDVFARNGAGYEHKARIPTAKGARTSLFLPETDRLYVAVPATSGEPAAIWVFRPTQ
jgi:DNA-binding beta-propeller fold protein YncE